MGNSNVQLLKVFHLEYYNWRRKGEFLRESERIIWFVNPNHYFHFIGLIARYSMDDQKAITKCPAETSKKAQDLSKQDRSVYQLKETRRVPSGSGTQAPGSGSSGSSGSSPTHGQVFVFFLVDLLYLLNLGQLARVGWGLGKRDMTPKKDSNALKDRDPPSASC